jgi:hypothetical protein
VKTVAEEQAKGKIMLDVFYFGGGHYVLEQ